jgi:hypothetical protein
MQGESRRTTGWSRWYPASYCVTSSSASKSRCGRPQINSSSSSYRNKLSAGPPHTWIERDKNRGCVSLHCQQLGCPRSNITARPNSIQVQSIISHLKEARRERIELALNTLFQHPLGVQLRSTPPAQSNRSTQTRRRTKVASHIMIKCNAVGITPGRRIRGCVWSAAHCRHWVSADGSSSPPGFRTPPVRFRERVSGAAVGS